MSAGTVPTAMRAHVDTMLCTACFVGTPFTCRPAASARRTLASTRDVEVSTGAVRTASKPSKRPWRCRLYPDTSREPELAGNTEEVLNAAEQSPKNTSSASSVATVALAGIVALTLGAQDASALSLTEALVGPLFEPLNSDSAFWTRVLVWADFRVAVALFVISPLVLFFWSFARGGTDDAVKRVLIGYWEASSLLMLTVFLNIAEVPYAAFTGLFVQGMIPIALTWWTDLLSEIDQDESMLARMFRWWKYPAVAAAVAGVAIQVPFQGCNFVQSVSSNPMCAAWVEPPHAFHNLLISGIPPDTLQAIAVAGCAIYFGYLTYLASFVVPKVGRSGRKDRNMFSSVSMLKQLGWIHRDSVGN